jgi:hypothetical protein
MTSVDVYLLDRTWVFEPSRMDPITNKQNSRAPNPLSSVPADARTVVVEPGDEVETMVGAVQRALGAQRLATLFLGGHGGPKLVNGETIWNIKIGKGIHSWNAGAFAALQSAFDPYKRVIRIHSCNVGSDKPPVVDPELCKFLPQGCAVALATKGTWSPKDFGYGYQLVKGLANSTHAPVKAAIDAQDNYFPFFRFTGKTIYVYPDDPATEDRYIKDDKLIKHNDFCTLDYDYNGNLMQQ